MISCPEIDEWLALQCEETSADETERLEDHLKVCADCTELFARLREHDALEVKLREAFHGAEAPGRLTRDGQDAPPRDAPIESFEDFTIVRELSRTHFSIVYEATQKSTGQRVALKVLLASAAADPRSRLRFEREVDLLARLRHPNIVPVFDSGLRGGQYYFVMPYIKGHAPDMYAESKSLGLRQRVELMRAVCAAVAFAHQKGVMHRDLKPSNIIVDDDGRPHVLDFGLAKIKSDQQVQSEATLTIEGGAIIGTPAYMAPEQAAGMSAELDTRTDVYALGMILYRLALDRMPYTVDHSLHNTLENVQFTEPARPSSVQPGFDRDVEAVILKALEKEPDRRYPTAAEMGEDLERYLQRLPVLAQSPSTFYRFRKLVARHKAPFALLAAIFVLLAGFAVTVTIQSRSLAQERDKAVASLEMLEGHLLDAVDPRSGYGADAKVREVFNNIAADVDKKFKDHVLVRAHLHDVIGRLYTAVGYYGLADRHLREAYNILLRERGDDDPELAASAHHLGAQLYWVGQYDEAEKYYRQALGIRQVEYGDRSLEAAETLNHLAAVRLKNHDFDEAERLYLEVLDIRRAQLPSGDVSIVQTLNNLAVCLREAGRLDQANKYYDQAKQFVDSLPDESRVDAAIAKSSLGTYLMTVKRYDEAEAMFREAIPVKRMDMGEGHPSLADSLHGFGKVLMKKADFAAAQAPLTESLAIRMEAFNGEGEKVDASRSELGRCLTELGQYDRAETYLLETYESMRERRGANDAQTLKAASQLHLLYEQWGRSERASEFAALAAKDQVTRSDSP